MADRDKVIKGLQCCSFPCKQSCHECPYYPDGRSGCSQLAQDALELLEKQVPKPVKVTKNTYNYEFYNCPNCGRGFELTYYKKPAYCDKCGQAVKWNDDINMP